MGIHWLKEVGIVKDFENNSERIIERPQFIINLYLIVLGMFKKSLLV